jgi:hypothetical protein
MHTKFRMEIMPNYTKCHIESNTKIYKIARNVEKIGPFSYKISTFANFQKSLSLTPYVDGAYGSKLQAYAAHAVAHC